MFHILRVWATTLTVGAAVLFGSATVHAQGVSRGGYTGGNFGAYYRPGGYYDGGYHPAYSYSPYLSQYGQNRLLRIDDSRPAYAGSGSTETVVGAEERNRTPGYQADLGIYAGNGPSRWTAPPLQPASPPPVADVAEFNVILPGRGSVSFGRFQAAQDSGAHVYESPHLTAGETYSYQIQARWSENGQERTRTRTVKFRAGERVRVDFSEPPNG